MLSNIIDRVKLPFRKDKELYLALYKIMGFYPHKITYYKVALMHKSLGHRATAEELKVLEGKKGKKKDDRYNRKGRRNVPGGKGRLGKPLNNERLEFLGDAILDAVVGDVVYQRFPGKPEGFLTNARSKMVQRETLGRLSKEMGIAKLIMASGRSATHNSYMGGNAFEALVGAIYLDRGYEACQQFWTQRVMGKYLNTDKVAYKEVNFKSKILEWAQKNRINIDFRLEEQSQDKNGSPTFAYTVVLEGVDGCRSEGFSKKESQQRASEDTLKRLRNDNKFVDAVFAAKTERTKMEEQPISVAPDVSQPSVDDIVISSDADIAAADLKAQSDAPQSAIEQTIDDLNLDDVVTPDKMSREDIIAQAEAQAYEG